MQKFLTALLFLLLPFSVFSQEAEWQETEWNEDYLFEEDTGITITGTAQTSQQMDVIDKEEIERRNAADLAGLLQDALNININSYGAFGSQSGVTLRGFDSKRVAFLIDGVPADSITNGKFDLSQIDLNSIERIEVIYGGSDSKFNVSGALGGVINIITVKKQRQGWRFGGSVSNTSAMPGKYRDRDGIKQNPHYEDLLDTQNYSLFTAYGGDDFSLTANIFANRAGNHFLFMDYTNRMRRKDNNEIWDMGASTSAVWEFSNLSKLIASSSFYYGDKNFPTSGFSSRFGVQNDFTTRQSLMLEAPRAFHDDLAAELSLTWNFNKLDYTPPEDAASRHDQQSLNLINRWNWYFSGWLTLRSGLDYSFFFLDSTEYGSRKRHNGGIYITAEFNFDKKVLLIPSIKAVATGETEFETALVPKLGLVWNITDSFTLKNNYFRSFKFPDFEELYWTGGGSYGNPDLHPEDGWGGDIGTVWRITESIQFETAFFTQWIKNSIHWYARPGGIWRPENVGEAIFFGADGKISFEFPVSLGFIKKIETSLSYQYLRSYLLSFGYDFDSSKRVPYNPEHTIGGSFGVFWDTGSFLVSGHFESIRYNDRANLTVLEPYFLLNATVNQKIGGHFSAFAALRNILNTSYESFYDYPMPGITLTLGCRFNVEIK
jgi:vitamin B12 transporter